MCIALLIGENWMKALEPTEIIVNEDGSPYACITKLAWSIVGPIMNDDNSSSISCHCVTVRDATISQVASHFFK